MERSYLDEYQVLNTLGEGGFSEVKLVQDSHNQKFAAKILKEHLASMSERQESCLLNEVNNLKLINHPNVLGFIKFQESGRYRKRGREKRVTYIIMELCENGSLFDFVFKNGFMEERLCRFYFSQILDAVQACHSNGICHRDIKPENVLFDGQFSLKLADLGFSTGSRGKSGTGLLGSEVGTSGYMAPEIYLGKPYRGEKVDIFSLGVVLFIMRAYNPPFIKATLSDSYYRLLMNDESRFWTVCLRNKSADHFSGEFRELIRLMLSYNPDQRPSIEEIRQSAWMAGPSLGPLTLVEDANGNKVPATREVIDKKTGVSRVQFSGRMYRTNLSMRSTSIFNEDYVIENISNDEFSYLRYSKILTSLEPNNIISSMSVFFEHIQATYSPITPELKLKVNVAESEDEAELEFRVKFYRLEDKIVIYLIKRKGEEFGFIDKFGMLREIIREQEELVLSELVS